MMKKVWHYLPDNLMADSRELIEGLRKAERNMRRLRAKLLTRFWCRRSVTMSKSRKGPEFEREVAKDLSLWWTSGQRDDIFWRTQNSGGRATARKRKGKTTQGQYGDIQAVDPLGAPLMKFLSFELKRGYNVGLDGIFKRQASWLLPAWIEQARTSANDAGSYAWALIVKRDFHPRLLYCPHRVFGAVGRGAYEIVDKVWFECKAVSDRVMVVPFDDFLKCVEPTSVMRAVKEAGLDVRSAS